MNLFTKIILKFLSVVALIVQVIFIIAVPIFMFAIGALLFVPKSIKEQLLNSMELDFNIKQTTWILVISCIVAIAILICLYIVMRALRKIINNIYRQHFFVSQNLTCLKVILISFTSFIILDFASKLLKAQFNAHNVSVIFPDSWPNLIGKLLLLSIIFTIYIVFKYGMELQEDSNNVI